MIRTGGLIRFEDRFIGVDSLYIPAFGYGAESYSYNTSLYFGFQWVFLTKVGI